MRKLLLAALLLLFAVDAADARKRRHHNRQHPHFLVMPPEARGSFDARMQDPRALRMEDPRALRSENPRELRRMQRAERRAAPPLAQMVPLGWQLQPSEPNWDGKRFMSPDGAAWFALYKVGAGNTPVADHMKTIAFVDGETVTYLRGERSWVAVSGFKESRIFYRKAILACAGKAWHHIAFEYPAEYKASMDRFVAMASQGLDASQAECGETVSAGRPQQ